jgi:hypothetical protein
VVLPTPLWAPATTILGHKIAIVLLSFSLLLGGEDFPEIYPQITQIIANERRNLTTRKRKQETSSSSRHLGVFVVAFSSLPSSVQSKD